VDLPAEYARLVDNLERDGVRLWAKDRVWHQRAIHWLLRLVTFGGQSHYLDRYVTTLGNRIYVTPDWEERSAADRLATLEHEYVHVQQFRRWGFLPMAIAYLLLPLPVGLAWCRMRLERAAYEESIRVQYRLGGRAATERMRAHVIRQFTSGAYGWMWPFPRAVARWYDDVVARLEMS
jgi:hypothetical protein